ncbi:MAG TPA: alpha-L-fucosidase [Pyrinomonadaceae bacterium]|nr:alpha-L-fucosidase [Pyrinomonadaceae bacterium]
MNRRDYLTLMGTAAGALAAAGHSELALGQQRPADNGAPTTSTVEDRTRRMKWWHEAKFGMFIHWGLYSTLGRHEWVMENEGIPVSEYEKLAPNFKPVPNAARGWAQLAKRVGMKYMVMTTKHHEGFCNFDTKLTDYCAPKQGPGRDLVREYVDAARAEGMRVGFYYSLMDWHHPDGARCKTDEAARRRFVDYIHGQVRELTTNYGKLDILWYDVAWPLDAKGWESVEMNTMVRKLQPDIIINNRSKIPEDFDTPEQRIEASQNRPWESCMTLNDSWGYQAADNNWKSPTTVIRNLITCARDGGNYLLNIGPKPDGTIPEESVRILSAVGDWMAKNGATIRESDSPCQPRRGNYVSFTRKGNTLYAHVHYWPGETVVIANLLNKVRSAKFFATGEPVKFQQDDYRIKLLGLPKKAPDLVTTFALEVEGEPKQDNEAKRATKPREPAYKSA